LKLKSWQIFAHSKVSRNFSRLYSLFWQCFVCRYGFSWSLHICTL